MVSAFEQNLYTMTNRIHQLTRLSNEKENELNQLKLLVSKLLDVDDLKANDINQILDHLNKDEFAEDRNSKINVSKQIIRRHTFTSNEMQTNLSKCKSLETCASAKLVPASTDQQTKSIRKTQNESNLNLDSCDSPKASSSWLKITKAFKKTSLAKCSPMHKAAFKNENQDNNRANLIKDKEKAKKNEVIFDTLKNNFENDDVLLINLNSDTSPFNGTEQLNFEHQKLKKELDEKEKQLCDLRLELLNMRSENDRLSKSTKDKSLMSSKVSLFSVNSSTCNESIGNQSINNVNNVNLTARNSSDSIQTLTTATSASTNLSSSLKNLQPFNNLITSPITPNNELSYLEQQSQQLQQHINNNDNLLQNVEQKQSSNELSNYNAETINNLSDSSSRLEDSSKLLLSNRESNISLDKQNPSDILSEGKLISVQLRSENDKSIRKQNTFKHQPDQPRLDSSLSNEIGLLRISRKTSWSNLEQKLRELIDDYLNMVDCDHLLGLSSNSICSYELGGNSNKVFYLNLDQSEFEDKHTEDDKQPFDYLEDDSNLIIKLRCKSMIESFAFQNLIPKSVLLRLTNLLYDNKRLILAGPPGMIYKFYNKFGSKINF